MGFQSGIDLFFSLLYWEDNIVFSLLHLENLLYDNNLFVTIQLSKLFSRRNGHY